MNLIALCTGFFLGGPISGALSLLCINLLFLVIRSRDLHAGTQDHTVIRAVFMLWFALGTVAMPLSWLTAKSLGWNIDMLALIQSSGKYKSYRDWSESERATEKKLRQQEREKRVNEKAQYEERIASLQGFSEIKDLIVNGICVDVKYFGHIAPDAGYNPIFYGNNQEFIFNQPLDREGEIDAKWSNEKRYKRTCFQPDVNIDPRKRIRPSKLLSEVRLSVIPDKHSIKMIRDSTTSTRIIVDCKSRLFRQSYNSNNSSQYWAIRSMEPFIEVGMIELNTICANPGIKAMLKGDVFLALRR